MADTDRAGSTAGRTTPGGTPSTRARAALRGAPSRFARAGCTVLARGWAGVRWYVRELTGEAAYDRYVTSHAEHDTHPPLTRAQWWRARDDARESVAHESCC